LNFRTFILKAINKGKSHYGWIAPKQYRWIAEKTDNCFHLIHWGTKILMLDLRDKKVIKSLITSASDREGIRRTFEILKFPYVVIHKKHYGYIVITKQEFEEREEKRRKFRKMLLNKLLNKPDAFNFLRRLGFSITLEKGDYCDVEFERDKAKYIISNYDDHLAVKVLDAIRRLNGEIIGKIIFFSYYDSGFNILDLRLVGKDRTGQLWSLRLPPGLYMAKIETCLRWVIGANKEDKIVYEC